MSRALLSQGVEMVDQKGYRLDQVLSKNSDGSQNRRLFLNLLNGV